MAPTLDYELIDDSLSVSSIQGTLPVSTLSLSSLLLLLSISFSSGKARVTRRSIFSPAAAMRGTARQQSNSVVRVCKHKTDIRLRYGLINSPSLYLIYL